jgi:hypothetical protein
MTNDEYLDLLGIEVFNLGANTSDIKCVIVGSGFNQAELDLLGKMLAAIKLTKTDYVISPNLANYNYQIAFGIGEKLAVAKNHFNLVHPKYILNDPSLKREAWDILQQSQKLLN